MQSTQAVEPAFSPNVVLHKSQLDAFVHSRQLDIHGRQEILWKYVFSGHSVIQNVLVLAVKTELPG